MNRQTALLTAGQLISQDRQAQYGSAEDGFAAIAIMWEGYKGTEFSIADVAAMMAIVKLARIKTSPAKADSWVDLAGYAALGAEVARAE